MSKLYVLTGIYIRMSRLLLLIKYILQFLYSEDDNTKILLLFADDILIKGGIYPTKIGGTDMKTDERVLHQCHRSSVLKNRLITSARRDTWNVEMMADGTFLPSTLRSCKAFNYPRRPYRWMAQMPSTPCS